MSLYELYKEVEDPRKASGLRFPLPAFLTMMTMAYMSGYSGYRSSASFMEGNKDQFCEMFDLKHGVPGFVQVRTIINSLDFQVINKVFFKWINQFVPIEQGEWISGDGKGLNSTLSNVHTSKQDYQLMVRLFSQKLGIVLQTESKRSKTREVKAFQSLLEQLQLKGVIITLDALHCQKKQ